MTVTIFKLAIRQPKPENLLLIGRPVLPSHPFWVDSTYFITGLAGISLEEPAFFLALAADGCFDLLGLKLHLLDQSLFLRPQRPGVITLDEIAASTYGGSYNTPGEV